MTRGGDQATGEPGTEPIECDEELEEVDNAVDPPVDLVPDPEPSPPVDLVPDPEP